MKKSLALILALVMIFCVCGCNGDANNSSSDSFEIVYEHITIGPDGNESTGSTITSSQETTSSEQNSNTSNNSSDTGNTSTVTSSKNPIAIDYSTTVEVDICDDVIRGYLDATTPERQYSWLNEYSTMSYDYQAVDLDWYFDGSSMYTITISENADFSNAYTIQTKFSKVEGATFVPGKTYYWKVTGTITSDVLGGGKIHIKDAPVRWIQASGTANMRDMGGWKTASGKTVRYEMMYRGQRIDNLTDAGIEIFKKLGMKTEFDLRYANQKYQREGTGMNYVFLETSAQYDRIFNTSDSYKAEVQQNYRKIFEILSDKSNYPIYTHCSAGADRTGTFAFITNGLLGVSYEDLTRDFELTSFSSSGKRWRGNGNGGTFTEGDDQMDVEGNYVAWGLLYKEMMAYGQKNGCSTLQASIEHWLTSYVGVPQSQIDSFKSIMLK